MATPTKQQLTPPDGVKKACAVGIRLFEEGLGGDGLEAATVREARSIVRGKAITIAKAKKMVRWWGRNARFLTFDKDSPAWVAAQLWGGRAGLSWSRKLRRTFEAEDKSISNANEKKVSEKVRAALKTKAEEHNEKVKNAKTKRTNVRTLSAVFERGVGAYNTNPGSVRPSVSSADQWAYARVNSFLFCLRNGRFRSGKHDTDLLPKGHPQSTKKSANGEEPQHSHEQSMSLDLDSASIVEDPNKFSELPGKEQAIEIHYRITTPFQVEKGYGDMEDDDVKIRGPVYVGNQEVLDRHGELVEPDAILNAWEGYSKNPVILYNHSKNYGVIGRMDDVEMGTWEGVGDVVLGTAIIDGGEKDIVRKIRKGMLKAFSIGFIAKAAVKECKDEDECYIRFTEIDWIETSVVDIPASPNALFNVEKSILKGESCGIEDLCGCGCSGKKEVETKDIDLNRAAEEVAAKCIDQGDVIVEGSWSPPSAEAENAYIEENGWQKYGMWYLGRRADADPETKEHYAYPWSPNFKDCSRPGLNAIRSRSGQVGDEGVFNAAGRLRELMDDREEGIFIYRSSDKEMVGTDIYTTMEEAEARAEELGCKGSHSMEGPEGETLYMPCNTHEEYEDSLDNPDLPMKNISTDSKSNLTASVMNPLVPPLGLMTDEIMAEDVVDEVPTEVKEAVPAVEEAVVEESVETTDEVITEEAEATEEESVAEDVEVTEKSADDVLVQVVSVLKSVEERMSAIEQILDTTKTLDEEVESLKSAIAETEAAKAEAEAEAAIEAEVAKRVAEHLSGAEKKTASARKTLTTVPVDTNRKNTLDPNPHVSEGMNGLAKWLENQISNR